jgi:hypothetical protein
MVEIYKDIQKGNFEPNIKSKHFCTNFCPVNKLGKCETMQNNWLTGGNYDWK